MPRLYGFDDITRQRLREEEAVVVRQMASRARSGQGNTALSGWLNAEGHRTTVGGPWTPHRAGSVLDHPAIAGLVEIDGELVASGGPRIIEPEEFKEIRKLRASQRKARRKPAEYLISGALGICGLCSLPIGSSPSNSGSRGYRCMPDTPQHPGGCGKVRINADLLETYVAEQVLAELAKPAVRALVEHARDQVLDQAAELRRGVDEDRARQRELGREVAQGEISRTAFKAADRELSKKIREAQAEARLLEQVKHAPIGQVSDLVRWWKHAPLAAKSGLLTLMLERIEVYQAKSRGSRTVDDGRVTLRWRRWEAPRRGSGEHPTSARKSLAV